MEDGPNPPRSSASASRDPAKDVQIWPERRGRERYEIDTQLTANLLPEHSQRIYGRTLDISVAGVGGVFVAEINLGRHVLLEFHLPVAQERLEVEAVVRNRNGHRYGFEFVNLSGRDCLLIQKAVRVLAVLQ